MWAEANLIKSVLMNLLDNACKASEADGLIEVYGRMQKGGYRFEVKDHGVGIPKEEQHKITKAFYMVDKSRSRSRNGAGLGLAPVSYTHLSVVESGYSVYYQRTAGFYEDTDMKQTIKCTDTYTMSGLVDRARAYWGWKTGQ